MGKLEAAIGSAKEPEPPKPGEDPDFELELAELPRNDEGNAQRFIAREGHNFIWVKDIGWLAWDGKRWDLAGAEVAARRAALRVVAAMEHEAAAVERAGERPGEKSTDFQERVDKAHKWRIASGNARRLSALVDIAAPQLAREQEELDAQRFLFNVANGTLELGPKQEDGTVEIRKRGHRRGDLLTRCSPIAFDPRASAAPEFFGFLQRFLPEPAVQDFVQAYMGYALTGSIEEQCLMLFHGEGSNGKSTFVDFMAWLFGDYSMLIPIQSLMANDRKGGSEASPDLARLPGARLVRSSEPKQGAVFDESLLKQLTSGEPLAVRHLNKGFFDFLPTFKLVLSCNRRPTVRGDDDGIWRRLFMVPWRVKIKREEADKRFIERLRAEGPTALNWVLDGYRIWRERGLVAPDVVRTATDEYRRESDWLGNFLDASCTITGDKQDVETAQNLFKAYAAWCRENAVDVRSQTAFGRRLRERSGVTRDHDRAGSFYEGIKLVERRQLGEQQARREPSEQSL